MRRMWWVPAWGFVLALAAMNLVSCGHDQKLESLTIHPSTSTFSTPDKTLQVQYTATGTYIHPPATKDITNQVTWKADFAQLITFNGPGLVSPEGDFCGVSDISATAPEGTGGASNVLIAYASVTVNNPANPLCPGGGKQGSVSVTLNPSNGGSVTSSPSGIDCPGTCVATFTAGTPLTLTATLAQGFTSVTWTNCTANSGTSCVLTVPSAGVAVTANFQ